MKRKVLGIFVCMLLIAIVLPISAQLKTSERKNDNQTNLLDNTWYDTFGGEGNDGFYAVQQAPDGGYVVAGLTNSIGAGSFDAWLVKTNASGTLEWENTFGGTGDDRFHQMLGFMTGLKCPKICRERKEVETSCEVKKCCIDKGFYACYECDDLETCDKLKSLFEGLHYDASVKNLKTIKKMGLDAWIEKWDYHPNFFSGDGITGLVEEGTAPGVKHGDGHTTGEYPF